MEDFVHLHVHTYYSILDGQSSIPRLVDKAVNNGMRGMAITDHGDMLMANDERRGKSFSSRSSDVKCMWLVTVKSTR